jgi:hypothetical protein
MPAQALIRTLTKTEVEQWINDNADGLLTVEERDGAVIVHCAEGGSGTSAEGSPIKLQELADEDAKAGGFF